MFLSIIYLFCTLQLWALNIQEDFGSRTLLRARGECQRIVSELEQHLQNRNFINPQSRQFINEAMKSWQSNATVCQDQLKTAEVPLIVYHQSISMSLLFYPGVPEWYSGWYLSFNSLRFIPPPPPPEKGEDKSETCNFFNFQYLTEFTCSGFLYLDFR